jgi:hypothetical protein
MTCARPPLGVENSALPVRRCREQWRRARSDRGRCGWLLCVLVVCISASGASCPQIVQQYTQPIPRALPATASLQQVINVVNDNSARVQSLSTTRATVAMAGYPSLSANIAFQRPRSFRLVGQKFGPQVDLGSNDELLWFWIRSAQPPALFFCRHAEFATSTARQIIPVEPEWLIEALGVVTLDAGGQIEGPFPVGKDRLEIRSKSNTPGNPNSKITIVDDSSGLVLAEHVYDPQGNRLASAILSHHVRDPASGAKLPRHVEIQWPPANLNLSIDLADLQINQLTASPQELFTKPSYSGYNEVDLAHPNGQFTPNLSGPYGAPPQARY